MWLSRIALVLIFSDIVASALFRPPVQDSSLLISAINVHGVHEILRLDGLPADWMMRYADGRGFSFHSITGSNANATGFRALGFLHETGIIFWSNPLEGDVEWVPNFNVGSIPISDVHLNASTQVNGLTVDWLSHNVYWADTARQQIVVASVADPHLAQGQSPYHKKIITTGLKEPWGIVVDPFEGAIYWTDAALRTVNVADLSGLHRRVLYTGRANAERPTSLTLDRATGTLYWIDVQLVAIVQMKTDGTGVEHLYDVVESGQMMLRGISIYSDYLFTTGSSASISGGIIYIINRFNIHDNKRMHIAGGLELVNMYDIAMFDNYMQQPSPYNTTACGQRSAPACPHLCMGYETQRQHTCVCADGYTLGNANNCYRGVLTTLSSSSTESSNTPTTVHHLVVKPTRDPHEGEDPGSQISANISGRNLIVAVGICVGGLIIIIATVTGLYCYYRNRKVRPDDPPPPPSAGVHHSNPTYELDLPPPYLAAMANPVDDIDYELVDEKKEKI